MVKAWWTIGESAASLCAICGSFGGGRLCGDCLARFGGHAARCDRCAIQVPATARVCGACLVEPPPQRRAAAALDYAPPWDMLIADFKFRAAVDLAGVLAERLAEAVTLAALPRPALLLPAPLAPARLAARGYNQAWELARRLGRRMGIEAEPGLLLRLRETRHQLDLPVDERAANVRGAFFVDPLRRDALRGRDVALVDDVMTTGATAHEMARTVLAAGAAAVDLWLLARTPAPASA